MSKADGSQRFDAVRCSLSLVEGNWGRIWHATTLKERKDLAQALLRRVTVDRNGNSLELHIEPKAELRKLFRLVRGTGATGVASACGTTVRLHLSGSLETTPKASSDHRRA
jgi:hypothetical protein